MTLFYLCLKIFFARIIDVTLGTLRMVHTVKGKTLTAGIIAFIEVFIWFIIAREALNNGVDSIWIAVAYAGGYATGTLLGTFILPIIISICLFNYIYKKKSVDFINSMPISRKSIFITNTILGIIIIIFFILNSRHLEDLKRIIRHIDRNAFMVVNESKVVQNGFIK